MTEAARECTRGWHPSIILWLEMGGAVLPD
jgi:hypothetical protein